MTAFMRDRHGIRRGWHLASDVTGPSPVLTFGPVAIDITETEARITWTTDKACTGYVDYDTNTGEPYANTTTGEDSFDYLTHVQQLSNLTPDTTYYVRVRGTAADGTSFTSNEFTFDTTATVTSGLPDVANPMVFQSLVSSSMPSYLGVHNCTHQSGTTEIARVTNVAGSRSQYPSMCIWNIDGTRMLLGKGNPHRLLNGETYAEIATVGQQFAWAWSWSHVDPAIGFWRDNYTGTVLRKSAMNLNTGALTTLQSITASAMGHAEVGFNMSQGEQDNNDKYFAYCWRNSGGQYGIGVFDLQTWQIHAELQIGTGAGSLTSVIDHVFTSQTGAWMAVTFIPSGTGTNQGMWAYPISLSTATRRQMHTAQEHADFGRNAAGEDRFVRWSGSGIISRDPVTGTSVNMGPTSTPGETHVSCRNVNAPGYVYVGMNFIGNSTPGHGQAYSLTIDDANPNDARVFGFLHRTQHLGYDSSVFATPSPDGTKVAFAGPWESNGSTYQYVAGVDVGI